jgi:type IV pilus assembly protein PilC
MHYKYIAYNRDRELVSAKVTASSEAVALDMLNYSGLRVLSLKEVTPFFNREKLSSYFTRIKAKEVIMFSRQLALLIESGVDIAAALDLLREQIANKTLENTVADIANDIRGGAKLSQAMEKHPRAFSSLYCRTIAIAEETGNLEASLRQMADHLEKEALNASKTRNAFIYPVVVLVLAIIVIAVMIVFIMPSFTNLYEAMDADLPTVTTVLMGMVDFLRSWGLIILAVLIGIVIATYLYTRTPNGKYQFDTLMLKLPLWGRIIVLSELSRCCHTIATLFRAGVPLPEIITLCVNSSGNKVVAQNLSEVREELMQGQGLARPLSVRPIFLPLMVQMAAVGESTGNLDHTMDTVAMSYGMDATERTNALIASIQPTTTIIMGAVVAFIAVALVSTMYSVMGRLG